MNKSIFCIFIIALIFLSFNQNIKIVNSVSLSQPLTVFTGTVTSISQPKPIGQEGLDLGINKLRYTQNGIQFFRSNGNITIGLTNSLIPTTSKNTSLIQYSFSTVGLTTLYQILNLTNQYNRRFIISGVAVGIQSLSIPLLNPNSLIPSNCDTNNTPLSCTRVFFGSMGFDWSDMTGFTYNNSTRIISGSVTGTFNFDPIALDGSGSCTAATGTSCSATLTTTSSPDVVICGINIFNTASHAFSSITSSGLTFTQRGSTILQPSSAIDTSLRVYFTTTSSTLSSQAITATVASATYITLICFGVSGANTNAGTIFDTNAALPASNTANTASLLTTFSTSNTNDFIYNIAADDQVASNGACANEAGCGGGAGTLPASTLIKKDGGVAESIAYNIVSTTQSSKTAKASTNSGTTHNLIGWVDAICQSGSSCGGVLNLVTLTEKVTITDNIQAKNLKNVNPEAIAITDSIQAFNKKITSETISILDIIFCQKNTIACVVTKILVVPIDYSLEQTEIALAIILVITITIVLVRR